MNEAELESLVVRLLGDGSSYMRMMQDAQRSSQQTAQFVQAQAAKVEQFQSSLTSFGSAAVSALGALGAAGFLKKSLDMFSETETATVKLTAAIKGNGGEIQSTLAAYKEFAKTLKITTGASSDETLGLLKKAEAFGLTGKRAMEAVETSHRLAAAADIDAETAIRIAAALAQGDVQRAMMMSRLIPALSRIKDEAQFLATANRLVNIGQEQQIALMNTTEGVFKRFYGSLKAVTKQFGEYVSEAIVPVVKWVTQLIERYGKLDDGTKRLIVYAALFAAGLLAVLPVIASISAIVVPFIALFVGGFKLVLAAAAILLSPFLIIKGILIGLAVAIGIVFNPLAWVIAAVGLAIVGLVRRAGGMQGTWNSIRDWALAAWEKIKDYGIRAWDYIYAKAKAFYDWLVPIADAAASFTVTAWKKIMEVAAIAWDYIKAVAEGGYEGIKAVWQGIFGDAEINWGEVQDVIQHVILFAEYTLLNFERVSQLVWVSFQYLAVAAVNTALRYINLLGDRMAGFLRTVSRGAIDLDLNVSTRITDQVENILAQEVNRQRGLLRESFEDFVRLRREQFARVRTIAENPATNPVQPILDTARQVTAELQKIEGALTSSAEGVFRIRSYYARLGYAAGLTPSSPAVSATSPVPASLTTPPSPASQSVAADRNQEAIRGFLQRIAAATETTASRPPVTVLGVSLT